jgi:hypothetical protein
LACALDGSSCDTPFPPEAEDLFMIEELKKKEAELTFGHCSGWLSNDPRYQDAWTRFSAWKSLLDRKKEVKYAIPRIQVTKPEL